MRACLAARQVCDAYHFKDTSRVANARQGKYKILGLNDENERYLKNDLKTFYDFILSEIGLNIVE